MYLVDSNTAETCSSLRCCVTAYCYHLAFETARKKGKFEFDKLVIGFECFVSLDYHFLLCSMPTAFDNFLLSEEEVVVVLCLLHTSPSPRDATLTRMPSSA